MAVTFMMTTDELLAFAYRTVALRGNMPDDLRAEVGQLLVSEDEATGYRTLMTTIGVGYALTTEGCEGAGEDVADAVWVAATALLTRELGAERKFVADV